MQAAATDLAGKQCPIQLSVSVLNIKTQNWDPIGEEAKPGPGVQLHLSQPREQNGRHKNIFNVEIIEGPLTIFAARLATLGIRKQYFM